MKLVTGIGIGLCFSLLQACDHVPSVLESPDSSFRTGWTILSGGTANLNAVSGVSDKALWVVGDRGTIGFWNGTKLTWETSGTKANLRGVWALDAEHAYAVGDGGTILSRSPGGWQTEAAMLTRQVLNAVWADATRVVAVGSNGTVILGGAMGYQLLASPAAPLKYNGNDISENLFGVTGTAGGAVSAVGALGILLQLNGTTLSVVPLSAGSAGGADAGGTFTGLLVGAGTGPSGTYYVGQRGTVYRADATGINPVIGCPATALRAVSSFDMNAWVVGWDGTVCKVSGVTATSFQYTDGRWFNGIYAASAKSLWVVGASGTLLHGFPVNSDAGPPDATPPQDNL